MSCYNNLNYTKGFVNSISKHSAGHEIVWHLVDNGSTDGTYGYMKGLNPRFLDRCGENGSLALAWNKALASARTGEPDLVCLASNDVIVSENWLGPIDRERLAHAGEKVYWISHEIRGAEHEFSAIAARNRNAFAGQLLEVQHMLCNAFFPPEAIDLFHPIPEELTLWFGDNWIDYRLAKRGYKLFLVKDSSVFHFLSKTVEITKDVSARIERDKVAWAEIQKLI
jgi:GT2 family glycosyltransferase